MGSRNSFRGIDRQAVAIIRFKAWQLAKLPCFSMSDVEDLEQEMVVDMLHRLPNYDPTRAKLITFISLVIEHCAATLVSRATATSKGKHGCPISLDDLAYEGDQEIASSTSDADRFDLAVDVRCLIEKLPEEHRQICRLLMVLEKSEVFLRIGMSRATFYRRLVEIRGFFRDMGLEGNSVAA